MKRIIYLSFFYIILICTISAQSSSWVKAEGICNGANITPAEGWKTATNNARAEAIKNVVGVQITEEVYRNISESIDNDGSRIHDVFSKLSQSNSSGKIIEENIIDKTTSVVNDIPVYKVVLEAKVIEDKGAVDSGFEVKIVLPKDVFYDRGPNKSDKLEFNIWASKNCYLYLFNILSDDSVSLLIPNRYIQNHFYSIENDIQEYEKQLNNLSFEVALPPGKDAVTEALYLVALKNKSEFVSDSFSRSVEGVIPTYSAAIADIQRWLIQIPRDQRVETIKTFEIRKFR